MVKYKIGDRVWIKNQVNSPLLTILSINDKFCKCVWIDSSDMLNKVSLPLETLTHKQPSAASILPPSLKFNNKNQ
ncbi:MAG: hypothetical protein ACM34M_02230, partial [Ignavibacteria bacterium]